jgi:hypothetical protein
LERKNNPFNPFDKSGGGGGGGPLMQASVMEEDKDARQEREEKESELIERQDVATQVLSLLRSTTSLLSVVTWRQKRVITLRGDQTMPGTMALTESQRMFQETCMTEDLIEMMKERDVRIRSMRGGEPQQGEPQAEEAVELNVPSSESSAESLGRRESAAAAPATNNF